MRQLSLFRGRKPYEVPNADMQRAIQDSGRVPAHIARDMGWVRKGTEWGDTSRLKRAFGMQGRYSRYDATAYRRTCKYDEAVRLVKACGVDPFDYGV